MSFAGSEPSLPINESLISNGEKGVISKVKIKNKDSDEIMKKTEEMLCEIHKLK